MSKEEFRKEKVKWYRNKSDAIIRLELAGLSPLDAAEQWKSIISTENSEGSDSLAEEQNINQEPYPGTNQYTVSRSLTRSDIESASLTAPQGNIYRNNPSASSAASTTTIQSQTVTPRSETLRNYRRLTNRQLNDLVDFIKQEHVIGRHGNPD